MLNSRKSCFSNCSHRLWGWGNISWVGQWVAAGGINLVQLYQVI